MSSSLVFESYAGFFKRKIAKGGRNRDSRLRGGGMHVSVYMHVNVSTNNDSTK